MKFDGHDLIFSSGRKAYCHGNVLGIGADGQISYGWDGGFELPPDNDWMEPERQMTNDDLREIADEAIRRWAAFRDGLSA